MLIYLFPIIYDVYVKKNINTILSQVFTNVNIAGITNVNLYLFVFCYICNQII